MENRGDDDDIWELIKEHDQITPSPTPIADEWDDDGDTVVIRIPSTHSSVFPPFKHEDLPLIHTQPPTIDDGNGPQPWKSLVRVFRIGIVSLAHRVSNYYTVFGIWLRSVAAVAAGGVVVAFMVTSLWLWMKRWRLRRRRLSQKQQNVHNLKLLIKEKDQRIDQLSLQIAQMNEILSGRRRVPVFRVG